MEALAARSDDLTWPEILPEILHGASGVWLVMSVGLLTCLSLFSAVISRLSLFLTHPGISQSRIQSASTA